MSAPSGSGPTYLPIEYEYYYLEFVNWQNDNQGGGVSYNRTKNIINEPTFDDVNIIWILWESIKFSRIFRK